MNSFSKEATLGSETTDFMLHVLCILRFLLNLKSQVLINVVVPLLETVKGPYFKGIIVFSGQVV